MCVCVCVCVCARSTRPLCFARLVQAPVLTHSPAGRRRAELLRIWFHSDTKERGPKERERKQQGGRHRLREPERKNGRGSKQELGREREKEREMEGRRQKEKRRAEGKEHASELVKGGRKKP